MVVEAFDFLYSGYARLSHAVFCRKPTARAMKSIILRSVAMQRDLGRTVVNDIFESMGGNGPTLESTTASHSEEQDFVEHLRNIGLVRGDFTLLNESRLDLPQIISSSRSSNWMNRMTPETQQTFCAENQACLLATLQPYLENEKRTAPARVHALSGHYNLILERLHNAGMLAWSVIDREESSYTRIANTLTMTSFAVVKDQERDRLISWPRVQNASFPDPPYTELPNPGNFTNLRHREAASLSGFFLDVENMFHNVPLPTHLSLLFPLKEVVYGNLHGTFQRSLQKQLGFRPQQRIRLRPLQRSLPMGFKWAVYLAHTFVQSCYEEAFKIFLRTSRLFRNSFPKPNLIVLGHRKRVIVLPKHSVLVLHIIDDLNFVLVDWPDEETILLQSSVEATLRANNLPIRRSKSSLVGSVERNMMPFIGWHWFLRKGVLRPKSSKLIDAITSAMDTCQGNMTRKAVRSTTGRLIWICLGCRPMLSMLYRTFQYTMDTSTPSQALLQAVRRELFMMSRISSLSCVRIHRKTWTRIIAFDACKTGGAVVFTDTTLTWVNRLIGLSICNDSGASEMNHGIVATSDRGSSSRYQTISRFISSHTWKTAFVHHWNRPDHINALEAHTAVLSLEWASSFHIQGFRVLLLSDSSVTIGAFRKGRSSSYGLCLPRRRYAAVAIAHDLDVFMLHVASELNPADGPSRLVPQAGSQ